MNSNTYKAFFHTTRIKILLLLIYFISVNLLAGYAAVLMKFPSLWGNSKVFGEYAIPIFMTWGMAHWPSLIVIGISLFFVSGWNAIQIQRFRVICLSLLLVLIYGVIEKIPFVLFPAVDLLVGFFFSLIIVPPSYKENPKLTISLLIFLSVVLISSSYYLYSKWQHRTPEIKESNLMNGLFELKKVEVNKNYKELIFTIELTQFISQNDVCRIATEMSNTLFKKYSFDKQYKRIVQIIFNQNQSESIVTPYHLGLLEQYKENGEMQVGCYLMYK